MSVSAIIRITQFESDDALGRVRDRLGVTTSDGRIYNFTGGIESSAVQQHLPAVVNPYAKYSETGLATDSSEDWSDSPTNQPNLLYRYRFSWGRDKEDVFTNPSIGNGQMWGNLDNNSGQYISQIVLPLSSDGRIREVKPSNWTRIRNRNGYVSSEGGVQNFAVADGETTVSEYPFLLIAEPEPFSEKNPVNTDVFIRLSNYAFPISSGTITLYLDDELQTGLQVSEFFGGLGGFNVTWPNSDLFDYDAQVDVKWQFRDTDVPANRFEIRYPFYTVQDLSGPRVTGLVPANGATSISTTGPIQFTITDYESDVDLTSLSLYVNNVLIVDGDNGSIATTRLSGGNGYTVVFTPEEPWLYGDLIPVAIFVKDTSVNQNETFFAYSFTTTESTAPRLINITPAPCTVGVSTGTDISVDVIDGGHGLDPDSIVFTVEEIERGSTIQLIPIVHRDD